MDGTATLAPQFRQAFQAFHRQHARLLRLETLLGADALIVARMRGREAVNECFEFVVDCVAPSARVELKALLGQPMTLRLARPGDEARAWHGYVTRAASLGSDGGLARYRLHLGPWLAFLARRRNCLIFQDLDTRAIVERVFADYPRAAFTFDLTQALPQRDLCTQYRETDLAFIERLLAEEGLSYCFDHDQHASVGEGATGPHAPHRLRIFDHRATVPDVAPARLRFHRVAAPEREDTITAFRPRAAAAPNAAVLSAWDAFQLQAHAATASTDEIAALPPLALYDGACSSPRHRDPATLQQSTEHTLYGARLCAHTVSGAGSARQLTAGWAFELTDHPSDDGRYIALAVEHTAANNLGARLAHWLDQPDMEAGSYRNRFVGVPAATAVVPATRPKPHSGGPESAIVVGLADHALTSQRDHRVKVQFPWQRGRRPQTGGLSNTHSDAHPEGNAPGDETAGTWVRVSERLAGPNWGSIFVPRIATEVLIDYLEGDIDQPVITGQLYNGRHPPPFAAGEGSAANHPGTLTGAHTHGLDGNGHNQWVIDDAPGQLRQRLASSQTGDHTESQLNLGYLITQERATRGAYRGQGAELATTGWAILRAPQGLLLSTAARRRATSTAQDVREAVSQLQAAHARAHSLSKAAWATEGEAANIAQAQFTQALDPERDGVYTAPVGAQDHHKHQPGGRERGPPAERFNQPAIVLDSPSTITATTPASALYDARGHTHATTQGEAQHTAAATYSSVSGATTRLFTQQGGAQVVTAHGPLSLQAHDDALSIHADEALTVTSHQRGVDILAQDKLVLSAGRASVTLDGPNITFACPGKFTVQGGAHRFVGATTQPAQLETLPTGTVNLPECGEAPVRAMGSEAAKTPAATPLTDYQLFYHYGDLDHTPVRGVAYRATLADGQTRTGRLDDHGQAALVQIPPGPVKLDYQYDKKAEDDTAIHQARAQLKAALDALVAQTRGDFADDWQQWRQAGRVHRALLRLGGKAAGFAEAGGDVVEAVWQLAVQVTHGLGALNHLDVLLKTGQFDALDHQLQAYCEQGEAILHQASQAKALLIQVLGDPKTQHLLYDFVERWWAAMPPDDRGELQARVGGNIVINLVIAVLLGALSDGTAEIGYGGNRWAATIARLSPALQHQLDRLEVAFRELAEALQARYRRLEETRDADEQGVVTSRWKRPDGLEPGARPGKVKPPAHEAPRLPSGWDDSYDLSDPNLIDDLKSFGQPPEPDILSPGTKLYRIVGPKNRADSAHWILESPPQTEAEWRSGWAVRGLWNDDGSYVEETVPEAGLNVWRGPAAAQKSDIGGWVLDGGKEQIWMPKGTLKGGPRKPTPWAEK